MKVRKLKLCETIIRPRVVKVASATEEGVTYDAIPSTMWNDSLCECRGFRFRGSCRHVKELDANRCRWVELQDSSNENLTECPECGEPAVTFNPAPEFDDERREA